MAGEGFRGRGAGPHHVGSVVAPARIPSMIVSGPAAPPVVPRPAEPGA